MQNKSRGSFYSGKTLMFLVAGLVFTMILAGCGVDVAPPQAVMMADHQATPASIVDVPTVTALPPAPSSPPEETPTPVPSLAPTDTPSPAATSTTTPTHTPMLLDWQGAPLEPHSWTAGPVLFRFDDGVCVDFCGGEFFSAYPTLILYADGRLIASSFAQEEDGFILKQSVLSRGDICALLNTFDGIGLFDYDPAGFYKLSAEFPGLKPIEDLAVNAWESAELGLGGVRGLLGRVELDRQVVMAYHFMKDFEQPSNSTIYHPEQIVLLLIKLAPDQDGFSAYFASDAGSWPLDELKLADLYGKGAPYSFTAHSSLVAPGPSDPPSIVQLTLSGREAELMLSLSDNSIPRPSTYEENGERYVVAIRGLLPYETADGISGPMDLSQIPGPSASLKYTELSCSPQDGVLDFYEKLLKFAQ